MKQLSGLDASFLYMETAAQFGHVSSVSIYERPADRPEYDPLSAWREQLERRLHLLEPLRRRLVVVPLALDHPFWVDDPNFDLDFHVRHNAVPPPGDDVVLAELVSRIIARPMDRSRPLWETYVIEGLPGDRFAILTKVHHATIDGASGAELLTLMLDRDPAGDVIETPSTPWNPDRLPSDAEVLARAASSLVRKPGRALLLVTRTTRELGKATRNPAMVATADRLRSSLRGPLGSVLNIGRARNPDVSRTSGPSLMAPRTPFNAAITSHRRFAFRSVSLSSVKDIKNACDATLNDVVMAVCAGGLRTWLERHDALPAEPLIAMVPVSIRTGRETDKWSNRVGSITSALPTNEPDAVQRVHRVHESMKQAKELFDAVPAEALSDFTQFAPPAVFAQAMRTSTWLSARFRTPVNVTISNVPGPREALYAAGAKLLHYYPVSTIVDGQGLNITVQSYLDHLDFGLVSCRELVPDLWDLLDDIINDFVGLGAQLGILVGVDGAPGRRSQRSPSPALNAQSTSPAKAGASARRRPEARKSAKTAKTRRALAG